jgi:hypothetical protein
MEAPKPTLAAVLEKENLNRAWEAVRANKGAPGPEGRDIVRSQAPMRENWENIEAKLRSGEYNPGPVRAVTIPKPNGEEGTLGVPNVQDRLIQQAIHAKLNERCEPFFSEHSYGFRPKRSPHDGVRTAQEFIKQGKKVWGGHRSKVVFRRSEPRQACRRQKPEEADRSDLESTPATTRRQPLQEGQRNAVACRSCATPTT